MSIEARTVPEALDELALRIARLRPQTSRKPDDFYEERSEIAHDARAIATWARSGRKPIE